MWQMFAHTKYQTDVPTSELCFICVLIWNKNFYKFKKVCHWFGWQKLRELKIEIILSQCDFVETIILSLSTVKLLYSFDSHDTSWTRKIHKIYLVQLLWNMFFTLWFYSLETQMFVQPASAKKSDELKLLQIMLKRSFWPLVTPWSSFFTSPPSFVLRKPMPVISHYSTRLQAPKYASRHQQRRWRRRTLQAS